MSRIKRIFKNIINSTLDRDCHIRIIYLHDFKEDKHDKILNGFNIYIQTWIETTMMMGIDIENAKRFHSTLISSNKPVKLTRGNNTCFEYIIIPKWAMPKLAKEIEKYLLG